VDGLTVASLAYVLAVNPAPLAMVGVVLKQMRTKDEMA
jgi:hypothetical protein